MCGFKSSALDMPSLRRRLDIQGEEAVASVSQNSGEIRVENEGVLGT